MKKRNGFLKLIEPFTNFTQCVETILFDEDKKKLFIEKYSVCELVLIIVDLM